MFSKRLENWTRKRKINCLTLFVKELIFNELEVKSPAM